MKEIKLTLLLFMVAAISAYADDNAKVDENQSTVIVLQKTKVKGSKFPQKPAYSPVYCMVAGNEIDVYCQYEATGDILVVDSRTGLTVASETAIEVGEGYTLYIPDQYAEAPLTIYVTIAGTTYWAEI